MIVECVVNMDKKILSILVLLVVVVSATVLFVSFKESSQDEQQDFSTGEDLTDDDISNEIDDAFIPEDDEIDIGDMI